MSPSVSSVERPSNRTCQGMPFFERLNYFYGQMLGVGDLRTEQNFFREKIKLHNRCLHGHGVVCGLAVEPAPLEDCCDKSTTFRLESPQEKLLRCLRSRMEEIEERLAEDELSDEDREKFTESRDRLSAEIALLEGETPAPGDAEVDTGTVGLHRFCVPVRIRCGLALDCCGNEIIAHDDLCVDLMDHLSVEDRANILERVSAGLEDVEGWTVYLSVCYREVPIHPMRPVLPEACGAAGSKQFGRLRDGLCVVASLEAPADEGCRTCCDPCEESCVLLARVDRVLPGRPLTAEDVHNEVRRPVSTYRPTRIVGVNWAHGATYDHEHAENLVAGQGAQGRGIVLRFSRPVLTETLKPGVVEVWLLTGGGSVRGNVAHLAGTLQLPVDPTTQQPLATVHEVEYRVQHDERFSSDDQLLIRVRAGYIYDECCRRVDGEAHPWIPVLEGYEDNVPESLRATGLPRPPDACRDRFGPWASGNDHPGGDFESWIYIR